MFATYRSGRFKGASRSLIALAAAAVLLLAGCGDSGGPTESSSDRDSATAGADARDLDVIEGWSRALSAGDVEGAAGYFAVPSVAENGGLRIDIRSREDAVTFNESLPCGAKVVAARTVEEVTTATFLLSDRPGGDCGSGAGGEAATAFRIENEEIVEWQRVAVPGGDDAAPTGAGPGAPA